MHIVIILFIAVVLGVAGTLYYKQPQPEEQGLSLVSVSGDPVTETSVVEEPIDEPVIAPEGYKDGTYEAVGTYTSPASLEEIKISITIQDNVVTATTFEGWAENPASAQNQVKFNEGINAAVVGRPLDSINLTVVNGSSLTSHGFMDALRDIKIKARI